jgi:hypothetical protein
MDLHECDLNLTDAQWFAHNDPYPLLKRTLRLKCRSLNNESCS